MPSLLIQWTTKTKKKKSVFVLLTVTPRASLVVLLRCFGAGINTSGVVLVKCSLLKKKKKIHRKTADKYLKKKKPSKSKIDFDKAETSC